MKDEKKAAHIQSQYKCTFRIHYWFIEVVWNDFRAENVKRKTDFLSFLRHSFNLFIFFFSTLFFFYDDFFSFIKSKIKPRHRWEIRYDFVDDGEKCSPSIKIDVYKVIRTDTNTSQSNRKYIRYEYQKSESKLSPIRSESELHTYRAWILNRIR